jgi:hypothetical protein
MLKLDNKNYNNSPDPNKPGVPLNPEKDGWHWVQWPNGGSLECQRWGRGVANFRGWAEWRNGYMAAQYRYLGPVLTPEEIKKYLNDFFVAGILEAARIADDIADTYHKIKDKENNVLPHWGDGAQAVASALRHTALNRK